MKSPRPAPPALGRVIRLCASGALLAAGLALTAAEPRPASSLKTESFDHDPGWEAFNNHIVSKKGAVVKQDFGYSPTHFAGKGRGEMGGKVQRATAPACYADKLAPKTLDDKLSASGSFAITACMSNAGVFFGFFNSHQTGGTGRAIGSLGMDFDFEKKGARLALRMITDGNKSCGTFITPYLPGKYRPTPIKIDGTRYHWTLDYDPKAAGGNGRFTFTLGSDNHPAPPPDTSLPEASQKEALARFPYTTTFSVDLTPEIRKEGATFDRFGLLNGTKAGGTATIFFDELQYNGKTQDFSQDPGWTGEGNRISYENGELAGAHDFGYLRSHLAGGSPGEVGGLMWRSPYAYYADRVGSLSLRGRLEARGSIILAVGAPDSGMMLGWFNSEVKEVLDDKEPLKGRNFIGVSIGGPTRIGHYFLPFCATATGGRVTAKKGPVLKQGKAYPWTFVFDPAANEGRGQMRATLGEESVTVDMRRGQKPDEAVFDRFGLFTIGTGGAQVKVYFDDLQYTASPAQ